MVLSSLHCCQAASPDFSLLTSYKQFNTTDLKSFASGVDVVGSRMAFVVWGMLGCVMISTIFMVAALFQCRNKCCIEVEPRTKYEWLSYDVPDRILFCV